MHLPNLLKSLHQLLSDRLVAFHFFSLQSEFLSLAVAVGRCNLPSSPSKADSRRETFALRGLSCQGWRRRRGRPWRPCRNPSGPSGRAGPRARPRSSSSCAGELRRGWRLLRSGWCFEVGSWTFRQAVFSGFGFWQKYQCQPQQMRWPWQKREATDWERIDWKHPCNLQDKNTAKFYLIESWPEWVDHTYTYTQRYSTKQHLKKKPSLTCQEGWPKWSNGPTSADCLWNFFTCLCIMRSIHLIPKIIW